MGRLFSAVGSFIFIFLPSFTISWVYMWQASEYKPRQVWSWLKRTRNFRNIQHRRKLERTAKASLLILMCWVLYVGTIIAIGFLYMQIGWQALAGIVLLPVVQIIAVPLAVQVGYVLIQKPREKKIFNKTKSIIAMHPGVKIAVAGSFGKTTMKTLLATVLDEKLHVAATHGNLNTPLGIAGFAKKLDGSEDVLIFEFGEEQPGDVAMLAELTSPSIGILTGVSSAHMESFKTLGAVTDTIFELAQTPTISRVYKNLSSDPIRERAPQDPLGYSMKYCDGWEVVEFISSIEGLSFTFRKGDKTVATKTKLIGEHLIGPLLCCVAIADYLGLSPTQIASGIEQARPFAHRMQPRTLHGALIIDDTYNGNPSGVAAGLKLLKDSGAKRRIYVTPGLVEQGKDTEKIHINIGRQIADSADIVVLMKNSVMSYIKTGLTVASFKGRIIEVDDPLTFYTNLDSFVAAGDVVLMQNDWTDNYA